MDDERIIDLYFARDEAAISETKAKYGRLCYGIAFNILGNHPDSQECENDTYLGLWNAIPPARPVRFPAFLSKVARNLSLKRLEAMTRQKRRATLISIDELADILPDDSIREGVSDGDISRAISDFLRTESVDARRVFIRKYFFFDSVGSIASRYSFSESRVKSMLYRTRQRLKEHLLKEGIEI